MITSSEIAYPILYSFRRCPYAIRARMTLSYAKINYQHREIILKNKPAVMLAISPKGTVPVLQLDQQQTIDESLQIIYWALSKNDPKNWFVRLDNQLQKKIESLIKFNDDKFKPLLDKYKYAIRYPEHSMEYHRKQSEIFLAELEGLLKKNTFLVSQQITLADTAIFPFIRQFSLVDSIWFEQSAYTHINRWLCYFKESKLFNSIMQKHPVWTETTSS